MTGPDHLFPELPDRLRAGLEVVPPVNAGSVVYYPSIVTLDNGARRDFVYLAEAQSWFRSWGVWPVEDRGKTDVDVRSVVAVEDSPSRLPQRFAQRLYSGAAGNMGGCIFEVLFADGTRLLSAGGDALDFIDYPPGLGPHDVEDVDPYPGRSRWSNASIRPDYAWCLFSA